jgi:ABC-type transport system involved in multi-copper enzyme maturation permease subunit
MKQISATLKVEFLKVRKSKVFWLSIVFFLFVVFMIGLLMFVQKYPEISGKLGLIGTKSAMLRLGEPNWQNYFTLLSQMMSGLGLVGYGFITSWVFGREYSDNTIKDILALPVSRSYIVLSKFIVVAIWSILVTIILFTFGIIVGKALGTTGWTGNIFLQFTIKFSVVSLLSILLCTPVAFFACYSRGYLLPIGFIILTMIMGNFTGLVGLGPYFPWSIPGIYSAPPGPDDIHLNIASYIILILTSGVGLLGTLAWWRYADQK